ncbi:OsmC family protein [Rhodocytophaga aerolata]|uniref:OsmC family protein n=1 Tax=Rhodocytophaga aerolata TaxID=455078 RepID=A0ABT8QYI4_9BACT|nr:OsmC family protein [Rhodocytophaga aerolata]MDO1444901.1 OsmC family protein [Rhodocytophaga aerolata]
MPTIQTIYQGNLRTKATHVASGNTLITDAPVDNNGKGEAFSPTDLVCAALGSCMMTIMGIVAEREKIELRDTKFEIIKTMASNPRKIAKIEIVFDMKANISLSIEQQEKLKRAALTCPVALSLHPDVEQVVSFTF